MGDGDDAIQAVDLIAALARLDLEAALAYEAAAEEVAEEELAQTLLAFARDHRAHLEALNETLESEGEEAVEADTGPRPAVLQGLLGITAPLGREVVVVTLLGDEQLTNLAYDAALSYDWDEETLAMLRRFQEHEEGHVAFFAAEHGRLGGAAPDPSPPAP